MNLDTVLTVAIGDMDSTGHKLSPEQWADFQDDMRWVLIQYGEVVAHAVGAGVGSDGPNEGVQESTAVFIVVNPTDDGDGHLNFMRSHVANVARTYGQSSVAFAVDKAHEPVFTATKNGSRPIDSQSWDVT